ncbi:MAG TPA: methyltransferase domain-containing protein [Acidobacteriaceae bacterium]|jgi:SAM-dependent methyltransferase|nr:methyltransferase domain-containing protein [Acidobacteriaceae bacterium]
MPALIMDTPATTAAATSADSFQRYYEEAGPDYHAWSAGFNMHFGYFRRGLNPFAREAMLEEMNRQVLDRLRLESDPAEHIVARILDMGCGVGATLRSIARRLPWVELTGITLVPWQLEQGRILNEVCPEAGCISLKLGNYEHTGLAAGTFDAVYAIESSCYARGTSKSAFVKEAHRLLRPGGRMVVADGFLGPGKLRGPQSSIYRKLLDCWAIETFGEVEPFRRELERAGFRDIGIERSQCRVTPSFLHVPWVTLKFLLTSVAFGHREMTRARWNNVLAPILLPLVGFPVGPVAYYIISATRV